MTVLEVTDWRGRPIKAGTKVLYHRSGRWKLGTVTKVWLQVSEAREWPGWVRYEELLLDIDWHEQSNNVDSSGQARGVIPARVTVWEGGAGEAL